MARKPVRKRAPAKTKKVADRYVVVNDRNVYHYTERVARRSDAAVVDGAYAAAVLMGRGMYENPIVQKYGKAAEKYLEEDTTDAPEVPAGVPEDAKFVGEQEVPAEAVVFQTRRTPFQREAPKQTYPDDGEVSLDDFLSDKDAG